MRTRLPGSATSPQPWPSLMTQHSSDASFVCVGSLGLCLPLLMTSRLGSPAGTCWKKDAAAARAGLLVLEIQPDLDRRIDARLAAQHCVLDLDELSSVACISVYAPIVTSGGGV